MSVTSELALTACKDREKHPCSIALVDEAYTAYNGTTSRKHFQVTLHPEHASVIKRTFANATWLREQKVWAIPWAGPDDTLAMRARLLSDMIRSAAYAAAASTEHHNDTPRPAAASEYPQPPRPDHKAPSEQYAQYKLRKSPEGQRAHEPPSKARAVEMTGREPMRAPYFHAKQPTAAPMPRPVYDLDDVDDVDMDYEARSIPDECREYATQQERHYLYERKSDVYETLHMTERVFDGRVMCVCIYGTPGEVDAYYAFRFTSQSQAPAFSCMTRKEVRYHNRALRVVAVFI